MEKLKVIRVVDEKSGTSKDGKAWQVASILTETVGQYPRKVVVDFWGDMAKKAKSFSEGTTLSVELRPESREYNGKYYTNIKAGSFEVDGAAENRAANASKPAEPFVDDDNDNDLPF